MTEQTYMTPQELRGIAELCDAMNPLWDALTSGPKGGVTLDAEEIRISVYDGNGDRLGALNWGDGGPAFFPTTPRSSDD